MTEEEILARMNARVAERLSGTALSGQSRSFNFSSQGLGPTAQELQAARAEVGALNPRNPGLRNQIMQSFKKLLSRSLSWYTRSFDRFHEATVSSLEAHRQALERLSQREIVAAEVARAVATKTSAECCSRMEREFRLRLERIAEEVMAAQMRTGNATPAHGSSEAAGRDADKPEAAAPNPAAPPEPR